MQVLTRGMVLGDRDPNVRMIVARVRDLTGKLLNDNEGMEAAIHLRFDVKMAKSKKKRKQQPRVKRMNRRARIEYARSWIPTYSGKDLVKGYHKHFGVDWRSAVIELKILGIVFDPEYIARRERSEAERIEQRRRKREEREASQHKHWHSFTDPVAAFLAGDFPALYDLEMRQIHGDDWDQQWSRMPQGNTIDELIDEDIFDEDFEQELELSEKAGEERMSEPGQEDDSDDDWVPF